MPALIKYTVIVHKTTVAKVWFAQAKYLQTTAKSNFVIRKAITNSGILIKNLFNNLSKYDKNIDGVYVNEYDGSFNKIHHHLVVKSDLKEYDFKYRLIQYWKNIGLSDVEKYDSSLGFSYYMSKHIGKTEINSWDFIDNL